MIRLHAHATSALRLAALVAIAANAAAQGAAEGPLSGLERLKDFRAMRASSSDLDWENGNADARPIEPNQTLTLADLEGPGRIAHIWFTIAATDLFYPRLLTLRMYWDGETDPSVEAPVGDFFAVGHGLDVPFVSLPVKVSSDGRGRNCYWPMPFRTSARLTVTNDGPGKVHAFYFYVDWQKLPSLPDDATYFHAHYRQEFPCNPDGRDYLLADLQGRGHYVGTVQSTRINENGWYGEGDDRFYVDGEAVPSIKGTGTEDYFCDGWGFRLHDGPFYGATIMQGYAQGDLVSVYRWHLPDPIPFAKSLRVTIERKGSRDGDPARNILGTGFTTRHDDMSSVAFWYQAEPHKPWPAIPPGPERVNLRAPFWHEGESFAGPAAETQGGKAEAEPYAGWERDPWSGRKQLRFRAAGSESSVAFDVTLETSGWHEVGAIATRGPEYGIYRLEIDGRAQGEPADFYAPKFECGARNFRMLKLDAGKHRLRWVCTGKNGAASGHDLGLDGIILKRFELPR